MFSAALAIVTIDFFLIPPLYHVFTNFADLLQFSIFSMIAFLVGWIEQSREQNADMLRELKDELDIVLNTVSDGITAQDLSGRVMFANASAAKLTGYPSVETMMTTPVEGLQQNFTMYDLEEQELSYSALPRHEAVRTGKEASLTFKMSFADGSDSKWIHLASSPVFDEDGDVKLVVNIFRDITEQIEAQQDLTRYQAIVQNSQDAIIGKSLSRQITTWNPGAEILYGYTADEAIGQHISILFPPNIPTQEVELFETIKQGNMIEHYETTRLHKDGYEIHVSLTISPIRRSDGKIVGYSTIERDITSRKMLEKLRDDMQSRVRKVLDNLTIFAAMLSPDGVILEANRTLLENLNQSFEDIVGTPFENLKLWSLSEENQTLLRASIMKVATAETVRYDIEACCVAGKRVLFDFVLAPIYDDNGEVQYLIASGVDITQRNQLMEELDAQRRQLDAVVQNVPGIIYDFTTNIETGDQVVHFASDYMETMLGYQSKSWRSNPHFWQDIVVAEDWEHAFGEAQTAYQEGRAGMTEFRCEHRDGHIINAESYFSFETKGKNVRQIGLIMDVTRRKRAEAQVENYMQELERSNEELQQFAYVASHDLQEPLRMVTSYLQLIEKRYIDQLDNDAKDFIDFAVDGATRMKTLINDLLAYSRVQRNTEASSEVDMQEVYERVIHNLQLQIKDSKAQITVDKLPTVTATQSQMVQLLQNLLSNAIKFKGDSPPKIHIGVEQQKTCWQFSVTDNGIGIEAEYQDRIFVIFQRLHTRQDYDGTGIGLAICRKIIDKHQGDIWFTSRPGDGSTFFFTLPVQPERGDSYASR